MKFLFFAIIFLFTAQVAFAGPPAGHGNKGVSSVVGGPPGLKGKTPAGKTPYGWSQGKKKGWYKTHKTHPVKPINPTLR